MRRAFTLIEVLIALGIGMLVLATAMAMFLAMRRGIARAETVASQAQTAAIIDRALSTEAGSLHPGVACRIESERDAAGSVVRLDMTWMSSLPHVRTSWGLGGSPTSNTYTPFIDHGCDLVWVRWRWRRDGGGILEAARSPSLRQVRYRRTASSGQDLMFVDFPVGWRDARRQLADDPLLFWPGASRRLASSVAFPTESDALDLGSAPVTAGVTRLRLGWVDRGGWTVSASSDAGLEVRDATGALASPAAGTDAIWSNSGSVASKACDGDWPDGRIAQPIGTGDTRTITAQRPTLVFIDITLCNAPREADPLDPAWVSSSWSFCHPCQATP
jgi:type II secretory pathway pseudopilin PulG